MWMAGRLQNPVGRRHCKGRMDVVITGTSMNIQLWWKVGKRGRESCRTGGWLPAWSKFSASVSALGVLVSQGNSTLRFTIITV